MIIDCRPREAADEDETYGNDGEIADVAPSVPSQREKVKTFSDEGDSYAYNESFSGNGNEIGRKTCAEQGQRQQPYYRKFRIREKVSQRLIKRKIVGLITKS